MRIGLGLPRTAGYAEPATVRRLAQRAEEAGLAGIWVEDRVLSPLTEDRPAPMLDPIGALHLVASSTVRLGLGAVVVVPWYAAVLLARSLTTLDVASQGRLTVVCTTGCSVDEYDATGTAVDARGSLTEEAIDVLEAVWRSSVVAYEGARVRIGPSSIEPKPVQHPRPPLLLTGSTPEGLERVARRGDGWLASVPADSIDSLASRWAHVRRLAAEHGRDPDAMRLVAWLSAPSPIDVELARAAGADEIILQLDRLGGSPEQLVDLACALADGAG